MKLSQKEKAFIDTARVARLATVDANGVPHNVAICPLLVDGKIYVGTGTGNKKTRNIKANPNVALAFDDYTEAWSHLRGIMVQGRARLVEPRRFLALRKKLYAKYLQFPSEAPLSPGKATFIEVTPERKVSWGLK